jgi:hypothetical protein
MVVSNRHSDWAAQVQKAFDAAVHSGSWKSDISEANVAHGLPKKVWLGCLKSVTK